MKKRLNALIILVSVMTLLIGIILFMLPRMTGAVSGGTSVQSRIESHTR